MKIKIIAIGNRMPEWVNQGIHQYLRRLSSGFRIEIIEHATPKRRKGVTVDQLKIEEAQLLFQDVSSQGPLIVLDETGTLITTKDLAKQLENWQMVYNTINILIGGPDGLAADCFSRADKIWSLSYLTLPHALVRVVLVEQIYRAWSILSHHPYHRE